MGNDIEKLSEGVVEEFGRVVATSLKRAVDEVLRAIEGDEREGLGLNKLPHYDKILETFKRYGIEIARRKIDYELRKRDDPPWAEGAD